MTKPFPTAGVAAALQDAVVTSIKQSQDYALGTFTAWNDAAVSVLPKDRTPTFEGASFGDVLPELRQIVDAGFAFAEELLTAQKDFSANLFAAATKGAK